MEYILPILYVMDLSLSTDVTNNIVIPSNVRYIFHQWILSIYLQIQKFFMGQSIIFIFPVFMTSWLQVQEYLIRNMNRYAL
jgi:membrane-anchored glycerophosphoryl diester phosphodiesterase (GDPDase)